MNREWSKNFDWNLNNTITWDRTFADTHHFTVTLVQEAEEHRTWNDKINARNITPSDALGFHYTGGANKEQSSFSTNDTHYTAASIATMIAICLPVRSVAMVMQASEPRILGVTLVR